MIEATNIYYFNTIYKIGGIETFFYQLAKKYQDYDLVILYKQADSEQLKRLKKYVKCIQYKGQKVKCEKVFFNFNHEIIDNIEAKEYNLVIHGDYSKLEHKPPTHDKINNYYGVSKIACDSFTELTGKQCKLCYNPLEPDEPKPFIKLMSASRLKDKVKGANRIKTMVEQLDKYCAINNCSYIWYMFTDDVNAIESDNIVYIKPQLNLTCYMKDVDYVVQLSDDCEGFNYTINESLCLGTPVIITPCKVYEELGINETMSFRVNFDMSNTNDIIELAFNKKLEFNYVPPQDNWNNLLVKSKSKYKEELKMKFKVKATDKFAKENVIDSEVGRQREIGEEFIVGLERKNLLVDKGFVKLIDEVFENKKNNKFETKEKNVEQNNIFKKQTDKNNKKNVNNQNKFKK